MSNGFQSNRITIFKEQYDAISKLPASIQGKVYKALMDYNFAGTIPKLDGTAQLAFDLIKAGLDVSLSKQRAGQIGGKQSPSKNQAERKQKPSTELAEDEAECKQPSSSIEKSSVDREDSIELEENTKVCMYESKDNNACTHERQSYEEMMDDLCVEEEVRPTLWEFIKHCQANGHTLINSKLERIILALDYAYGSSTSQKVLSLKKAINGGYFDVAESNRQLEMDKLFAKERELKEEGV